MVRFVYRSISRAQDRHTHRGLGSFVAGVHERETTVVLDTVQARRPGRSGHPNLLLKVLGPGRHRSCFRIISLPPGACSSPLTVSCLPLCCPESGPAKSLLGIPSGLAQQPLGPCRLSGHLASRPRTARCFLSRAGALPVPSAGKPLL